MGVRAASQMVSYEVDGIIYYCSIDDDWNIEFKRNCCATGMHWNVFYQPFSFFYL
jgi:NADH:ubiquinone oxidoreductase subunit H